jgi:hypothetical protein
MRSYKDKRKRLRIEFKTQVQLYFEPLDLTLSAHMKNISMNGLFVETDHLIPVNTPCRITVIINAPTSRLTIETEGFVCRQDPSGFGVKFKNNMEWFAFFSIYEHYGKNHSKSSDPETGEPVD